MQTTWVRGKNPREEPFRARTISLCLVGRHPIHSRSGYFSGRGLNASFTFGRPRSPGLVPWASYVY